MPGDDPYTPGSLMGDIGGGEPAAEKPLFEFADIPRAIGSGIGDAAQGLVNLPSDFGIGPKLWTRPLFFGEDARFQIGDAPHSKVGEFMEGATDFLSGFVPVAGVLGKVGKAKGILGTLSLTKDVRATREAISAIKAAGGAAEELSALEKTFRGLHIQDRFNDVRKVAYATAASQFLTNSGHEQRLSNMLASWQGAPEFIQTIADTMSAKDDDPALLARTKNALEQAGLGLLAEPIFYGVRALATSRNLTALGKANPDVIAEIEQKYGVKLGQGAAVAAEAKKKSALADAVRNAVEGDMDYAVKEAKATQKVGLELSKGAPEAPDLSKALPTAAENVFSNPESVKEAVNIAIDRLTNPDIKTGKLNPSNLSPSELMANALDPHDFNTTILDGSPRSALELIRGFAQVMKDKIGQVTNQKNIGQIAIDNVMRFQELFDIGDAPGLITQRVAAAPKELQQALSGWSILATSTLQTTANKVYAMAREAIKSADVTKLAMTDDALATYAHLGQLSRAIDEFKPEVARALRVFAMPIKRVAQGAKTGLDAVAASQKAVKEAANAAIKAADIGGLEISDDVLKELAVTRQTGGIGTAYIAHDPELLAQRIEALGGQRKILSRLKTFIDAYEGASTSGDSVRKTLKVARSQVYTPRVGDMATEVARGMMLSSPRTWGTVAGSEFGMTVTGAIRDVFGGLVGAGTRVAFGQQDWPTLLRQAQGSLLGLANLVNPRIWKDSAKYAEQTWREGESILLPRAGIETERTAGVKITQAGLRSAINENTPQIANEMWSERFAPIFKSMGIEPDNVVARSLAAALAYAPDGAKRPSWYTPAGLVQAGGRVIGTVDQFIQQLSARAIVEGRLKVQSLGEVNPGKYVQDGMDAIINNGELLTDQRLLKQGLAMAEQEGVPANLKQKWVRAWAGNEKLRLESEGGLSSLADYAKRNAYEASGQAPLEYGSPGYHLQKLVNTIPGLGIAQPFIATPYNLMKTAGQHMDVIGLGRAMGEVQVPNAYGALRNAKNLMIKDFLSTDPQKQAAAYGRIAMGFTAGLTILDLVSRRDENGLPMITGSGPANKNVRASWMEGGWRPYSVRIGDVYVPYRRLDPLAMVVGTIADVTDYLRYRTTDSSEDFKPAWAAVTTALAENFKDRSYFEGLSHLVDALDDPSGNGLSKYVRTTAAGAAIPAFLSNLNNYGLSPSFGGDSITRDADTFTKEVMKRIPILSQDVRPWRDVLGDPIPRDRFSSVQFLAAMDLVHVSHDKINTEFAKIGAPFERMDPRRFKIDLRDVVNPKNGQDAYDRWGELVSQLTLANRTLKDSLEEAIDNPTYQSISPNSTFVHESPRASILRGIIEHYRSAALGQLLQEYPQLQSAVESYYLQRQQVALGANPKSMPPLLVK